MASSSNLESIDEEASAPIRSSNFNIMSGFFRRHTNNVLGSYTTETISNFKNLDNDEDRIKYIFNLNMSKNLPIEDEDEDSKKSLNEAQKYHKTGNDAFTQKNFKIALINYTKAILYCPQTDSESSSFLALLFLNRSTTFYQLLKYQESYEDVQQALMSDNKPENLIHKMLFRKSKCLMQLKRYEESISASTACFDYLPTDGKDANVKKMLENDQIACRELMEKESDSERESKQLELPVITNPSQVLPSASSVVELGSNKEQGRYVYAKEHIKAGEYLVVEEPNAYVLMPEYAQTNCSFCFLSLTRTVPCPDCINVVFCSSICMDAALNSFHKYECRILKNIWKSGASINCMLALRLITSRNYTYFKNVRDVMRTFDGIPTKRKASVPTSYPSESYISVYQLCRHNDLRPRVQFLGITNMAVYLLRLLRKTTFFGKSLDDSNNLTSNHIFIGGLILRNLQLLEFNAHEICELQLHPDFPKDLEKGFTVCIGAGVYPNLAFFNHCCDPGVLRYNIGTKMIVRALKDHGAGEEISENYGALFTNAGTYERKKLLDERYWFECGCLPCEEHWPQIDNISKQIPVQRLWCLMSDCDGFFFLNPDETDPLVPCPKCNRLINILPALRNLAITEIKTNEGNEFLRQGKVEKALLAYWEVMSIYNKYVMLPFLDYVLLAQKIRTCLCALGNRSSKI